MPKKIDPAVKARCVRQVLEHLPEHPSLTAAAEAVARREGLSRETVRRWAVQAQIDGGQRQGASSEELAEIKDLKAKVRRLEDDDEILRRASISSRGYRPPQSLIVAFSDELRVEGLEVESMCRVLHEQGCQVAARSYRELARANRSPWPTREDLANAIFSFVEGFYNPRRRHSTLGYLSPADYETQHALRTPAGPHAETAA